MYFPFSVKTLRPILCESLYKENIPVVPRSAQMLLSWISNQNRLPMAPKVWGSAGCQALSGGGWVPPDSFLLGCGKVSKHDPGKGALCAGLHQLRGHLDG